VHRAGRRDLLQRERNVARQALRRRAGRNQHPLACSSRVLRQWRVGRPPSAIALDRFRSTTKNSGFGFQRPAGEKAAESHATCPQAAVWGRPPAWRAPASAWEGRHQAGLVAVTWAQQKQVGVRSPPGGRRPQPGPNRRPQQALKKRRAAEAAAPTPSGLQKIGVASRPLGRGWACSRLRPGPGPIRSSNRSANSSAIRAQPNGLADRPGHSRGRRAASMRRQSALGGKGGEILLNAPEKATPRPDRSRAATPYAAESSRAGSSQG